MQTRVLQFMPLKYKKLCQWRIQGQGAVPYSSVISGSGIFVYKRMSYTDCLGTVSVL